MSLGCLLRVSFCDAFGQSCQFLWRCLKISQVGVTLPSSEHLDIEVGDVGLSSGSGCSYTKAVGVIEVFISRCSFCGILLSTMLKRGRVRLLPSSNMNKGPGRLPLNTRYGKMPLRGQMMLLVAQDIY